MVVTRTLRIFSYNPINLTGGFPVQLLSSFQYVIFHFNHHKDSCGDNYYSHQVHKTYSI